MSLPQDDDDGLDFSSMTPDEENALDNALGFTPEEKRWSDRIKLLEAQIELLELQKQVLLSETQAISEQLKFADRELIWYRKRFPLRFRAYSALKPGQVRKIGESPSH